jgi:hypothetical protein
MPQFFESYHLYLMKAITFEKQYPANIQTTLTIETKTTRQAQPSKPNHPTATIKHGETGTTR